MNSQDDIKLKEFLKKHEEVVVAPPGEYSRILQKSSLEKRRSLFQWTWLVPATMAAMIFLYFVQPKVPVAPKVSEQELKEFLEESYHYPDIEEEFASVDLVVL